MKKFLTIILSVLIIISMSTTAFAAELNNKTDTDNAVITTQVPATHQIQIQTDGNGKVYFNKKAVNTITANRLSKPKILIRPESGFTIDRVMLGDEDITIKVKGGYYTFDSVYKDNILKITFKKAENGEFKFSIVGSVRKNGAPSENVNLELHSDIKTFTTGKDGKFGFRDVEEGHHTLTAVENGNVVGYSEFYLTRTDSVQNVEIEKNNDGSFNIKINKTFAILEMDFNITDDGILEITNGKATNDANDVKDYPNAPQTGDNSNMALWFVLAVFSIGVLVNTVILKRKK